MSLILKEYLANEAALKRFLRRFFARAQDIDDVAQETFLRAFVAERSQVVRAPKAFLFRIAKNLALNALAKSSTSATVLMEDLPGSTDIEDGRHVAPDEEVAARQRARLLVEAVASLPPKCAEVFLLRKIHGCSQKEIALRLNISESTVEKHIATGLVKCNAYLRRHGYDVKADGRGPAKAQGESKTAAVKRLNRVRDE